MAQLTGKADIYVNGQWASTSQEGSSLEGIAGVENSPVMNSRGQTAGYTSKAVPGIIKANFLHGPDFNVDDWTGSGMSVVFACDNGVTYQMASATFQKADSLDANKGLIAISFFGDVENLSS
jgi:Phage tail tube protein